MWISGLIPQLKKASEILLRGIGSFTKSDRRDARLKFVFARFSPKSLFENYVPAGASLLSKIEIGDVHNILTT